LWGYVEELVASMLECSRIMRGQDRSQRSANFVQLAGVKAPRWRSKTDLWRIFGFAAPFDHMGRVVFLYLLCVWQPIRVPDDGKAL
jgi:hypothetical protein